MIWFVISVLIVVLDQVSKHLARVYLEYGEKITIIKGFFYLTYHENKGAAWGMFQNGRIFFIIITAAASVVLAYILLKSENSVLNLSLSFILGGALGNLVDRIIRGAVPDFLDFYIVSYHFPTFNFADTFIVAGGFLLSYYVLFLYKET